MERYTHCTLASAALSSRLLKKTYEPRTGAMTVPIPLKAWEMLMRISEYRGGPQTTDVRDGHKLGMTRHTSDEWVGSSLKRTKSVSNDKDGHAKPSKRLCLDTRNSNQRANSIQAKTPDEDSLVRIMTEDPRSVSQRRKRISTETIISSTITPRRYWYTYPKYAA